MGRKNLSPEQSLREKAEAFKRQAEKLPYGREREELLLRARRLETASHIGKLGCRRRRRSLAPTAVVPVKSWIVCSSTDLIAQRSARLQL